MDLKKKVTMIMLSLCALAGIISLIFDSQLAIFFKSLQIPSFTRVLNLLEPTIFIVLFALVMIAISAIRKKKEYIFPIALSLVISTIVSFGIKFMIIRPRPFNLIEYLPFNLVDYSFPSSHCVAMFAMLPILGREFKSLRYLWIIIALFVAFTRLYFGVHYLSDIIFGSLIGYIIGLLIMKYMMKK